MGSNSAATATSSRLNAGSMSDGNRAAQSPGKKDDRGEEPLGDEKEDDDRPWLAAPPKALKHQFIAASSRIEISALPLVCSKIQAKINETAGSL